MARRLKGAKSSKKEKPGTGQNLKKISKFDSFQNYGKSKSLYLVFRRY